MALCDKLPLIYNNAPPPYLYLFLSNLTREKLEIVSSLSTTVIKPGSHNAHSMEGKITIYQVQFIGSGRLILTL